ncbi:uncharacterized protein LOC125531922 isoform X1 [Triticum urartu]|uniref:uncharacterized protein LOC125531922 isoform X1 n=1 Tax=Triticum urartu TaxID=4572 RepID=UPI00204346BD|nr:uncharacterized protein LOC125531922 isoform X1 [Triticum urartu]
MAATPPPPDAFAFSSDGELFAAVSGRRIQVWSTREGQKIAGWTDPIAAHDDSYSCIACSSVQKKHKKDGDLIVVAVGTANGVVLALDSTGVIWKSACHTGKVISLHFSKQGCVLITASRDGVICELDTWTGKSKDTLKASKKSINSLTVSHGKCNLCLHVLLLYAYLTRYLYIKVSRVCCIHDRIFTKMFGLCVKQCELH